MESARRTARQTERSSTLSIGMAKPMPSACAAMAVLMPTTSPNSFTNGPPEFPGLIAASVWMNVALRSGKPT